MKRHVGATALTIVFALFLAGCASKAGPFVTNISSDGRGGLVVEKCMAQFDPWLSVVSNTDCTTRTIGGK